VLARERSASPARDGAAALERHAADQGKAAERQATDALVERERGRADEAAAATTSRIRDGMLGAFRRSTQYEWLFWDGAYHRRGWPALG